MCSEWQVANWGTLREGWESTPWLVKLLNVQSINHSVNQTACKPLFTWDDPVIYHYYVTAFTLLTTIFEWCLMCFLVVVDLHRSEHFVLCICLLKRNKVPDSPNLLLLGTVFKGKRLKGLDAQPIYYYSSKELVSPDFWLPLVCPSDFTKKSTFSDLKIIKYLLLSE